MARIELILGDCIEKLKELKSNSIDTIVTDPPYGLNFMGKDWDKFGKDKNNISRFFYVAKASKTERNLGCEDIDIPEYRWNKGGICQQIKGTKGNYHPTVKPLKLMEYLCKLTETPTKGIVLDPFMGSGTTGLACININRDFIGIEKEEEYMKIAKIRIQRIRRNNLWSDMT